MCVNLQCDVISKVLLLYVVLLLIGVFSYTPMCYHFLDIPSMVLLFVKKSNGKRVKNYFAGIQNVV